MNDQEIQEKIAREKIANRPKHWVRLATACNSKCVFCLDMDTPRNVILPFEEVCADLQKGIDKGADKVILSGGEASLHPRYFDIIRFAKSIGYDRVQTVTNGWKYADKDFYHGAIEAGLGEITFSLHGHTAELHDGLTKHEGSFKKLIKSMVRALRDPKGPIVNVDVVINKQNVSVLDKIVELCISLGVREFDLLHVIPQSEAFRNRETLFYDVADHMEVLHKVFRLNRHPNFVVWTNRFPVSYLEGLEDLIQDPHKMLDEVHGRRFQVRQYIDHGNPLDCREKERCVHCFIAPFCNTMDSIIEKQHQETFETFVVSNPDSLPKKQLPFGCTRLAVDIEKLSDIEMYSWAGALEVQNSANTMLVIDDASIMSRDIRWVASSSVQLEGWIHTIETNISYSLDIIVSKHTADWILLHQEKLEKLGDRVSLVQPTYEKLEQTIEFDVDDIQKLYASITVPLQLRNLPMCLSGATSLQEPRKKLFANMFDKTTGRLDIPELSRYHIAQGYYAKSIRCRNCVVNEYCSGAHINMIRHKGLQILSPLQKAEIPSWMQKIHGVEEGKQALSPAVCLDGSMVSTEIVADPLAIIALEQKAKKEQREKMRILRQNGNTIENNTEK